MNKYEGLKNENGKWITSFKMFEYFQSLNNKYKGLWNRGIEDNVFLVLINFFVLSLAIFLSIWPPAKMSNVSITISH